MTPGTTTPTRRRVLRAGGAALALGTGLAGCTISTGTVTETVDVSFDPGTADGLAVETTNGDVDLSGGDGDAVAGTATKRSSSGEDALAKITVEGTTGAGVLTVRPSLPDGENVGVDLELTVPAGLPVISVTSSNGDVDVADVAGDGSYETTNGDVELRDVDGFVTARTRNGDVVARDGAGVDGARSVNGDVDVDVPAVRTDVTCRSTNGDVVAAVPDDLGVGVVLTTTNGDVATGGVPVTVESSSATGLRGRLDGQGDDGNERTLTLRSTNGDVELEPL